ncbi:phage gp6-like head-tail connector protein [Sphingobium sp. JS3065]|uniref:head-tail connector protein n=1 Tax=Sphingobium sp. JS3065 TaxID=2970925 RepID=UPI002263E0BE|nr:head-tail connector protein [Sphingobium sp. JS3065]UZW54054.1 phage gp6-like head-tail connector protein [Sphingobium sp. JS3065]
MVALITTAEAKTQLGVLSDDQDATIALDAEMATDIVMGYIKKDAAEQEWTAETVPFRIKAAIILVLRALFFSDEGEPLSDAAKALLHRDRDPAVA